MEYLVIALTALFASLLTFFSGFGLGTILLPVFAVFFSVDMAVALTGVVHLLNNLFKLALVGRHARREVVLRFGLPAIAGAFLGAWLLLQLAGIAPLYTYHIGERSFDITGIKLLIAVLMIFFAFMEILPRLQRWQLGERYLTFGGLLSGFFGGLSGHQGALRSVFLIKLGLPKEAFIATGVVIACLVDFSRLAVYFSRYVGQHLIDNAALLTVAVGAAFIGAYLGNRLLKKTTLATLQYFVAAAIIVLAVLMGAGVV